MYTIVMDTDKRLTQTVVTTLYQNENLVDKLKFIIPRTYKDFNILKSRTVLCYTTPSGKDEIEDITFSDEAYKNKFACGYLPIDSKLTKTAGEIVLQLIFIDDNQRVLKSGATTIQIRAIDKDSSGMTDDPTSPDVTPPGDNSNPGGFDIVEF